MKRQCAFLTVAVPLLFLVLLSGCKKKESREVTVIIKNPVISMDCVTDSGITESQEFLKKAWNAFASQYSKYNVKASFVLFEQTEFTRNVTECYDTPYAADILYAGYFNMGTYIHDGRVVPLDSIITPEIRDDFDEGIWASSRTSNGKTYMLPFTNLQNILAYNKDLFRKCGLDEFISDKPEIQGWSLEEWDYILATLKEKLPSGTYPMMMYGKNNQGDTHIMVQLRAKGSDFFDENGRFHLSTPEGIAGLQWLKDNAQKRYYPFNCEHLEINDCGELFLNNQLAIYVWNTALNSSFSVLDLGYVNFPAADKAGAASSFITGFMAFDNGDDAKLEVAKDFLQFIYTTPEWLDYSAGGIPCSKSVAARHADKIFMGTMLAENNKNVVDYQANNPNWLGVRAAFYPQIQKLLKGSQTAAQTAAALDRDCNAAIEEGYDRSRLHE